MKVIYFLLNAIIVGAEQQSMATLVRQKLAVNPKNREPEEAVNPKKRCQEGEHFGMNTNKIQCQTACAAKSDCTHAIHFSDDGCQLSTTGCTLVEHSYVNNYVGVNTDEIFVVKQRYPSYAKKRCQEGEPYGQSWMDFDKIQCQKACDPKSGCTHAIHFSDNGCQLSTGCTLVEHSYKGVFTDEIFEPEPATGAPTLPAVWSESVCLAVEEEYADGYIMPCFDWQKTDKKTGKPDVMGGCGYDEYNDYMQSSVSDYDLGGCCDSRNPTGSILPVLYERACRETSGEPLMNFCEKMANDYSMGAGGDPGSFGELTQSQLLNYRDSDCCETKDSRITRPSIFSDPRVLRVKACVGGK